MLFWYKLKNKYMLSFFFWKQDFFITIIYCTQIYIFNQGLYKILLQTTVKSAPALSTFLSFCPLILEKKIFCIVLSLKKICKKMFTFCLNGKKISAFLQRIIKFNCHLKISNKNVRKIKQKIIIKMQNYKIIIMSLLYIF